MPYPVVDMVLYFFIYSVCGWLMETVLCSIQERHFVNRGFLIGPLCPIYGVGVLCILTVLLPVRHGLSSQWLAVPILFIVGALLASAVEYAASWLMEKLFHARWWDYSQYTYNLNGRICLPISLAWGALSTFFVYVVQPVFETGVAWLYRVDPHLPVLVAAICGRIFVVDCVISARIARALGNKLDQLDQLGELIQAHLEGLELPAAEDMLLRVEAAYDRYAGKTKAAADALREKSREWRHLGRDELADRIRSRLTELKAKREALLQRRHGQKRLLGAFPTMRHRGSGDRSLLDELRERWTVHRRK